MIVEMRTYQTKPGMRAQFLDLFRAKSIPEHRRLGMPIVGPLLDVEHPDRFFFMRGFTRQDTREATKATFYDGHLWKEQLEEAMLPMLEHYDVVVVDDSEGLIKW